MNSDSTSESELNNLQDWLTISGDEVRPELEHHFELYRDRFIEIIEACNVDLPADDMGVAFNDEFARCLRTAKEFETVGDFLGDESRNHYALFAAFGLVLFDRINSRWDQLDKSEIFFFHEQLFECYLLSSKMIDRKEEARIRANKGHAKRREAKRFVVSEWEAYREDYKHNKTAFSRDYVRRVMNEFAVPVTEKQMREVWLLDALPASNPDGLQPDG